MCCDSGPSISQDPQVARASEHMSQVADNQQRFTEEYYRNVMTPLINRMTDASKQNYDQQQALFDLQYPQAQAQAAQYTKYGLPAQQKYYDMVAQYSEPEEYERQANAAIGDQINAQQVQEANLDRNFASRGIDPTSGAAVSARAQQGVINAASAAAAANRARTAARGLGMQLTAGAADFASGRPASNITMFAGGAGNASNSAFQNTGSAIGFGNSGAALQNQMYSSQASIYGQQMNTYADLAKAQAQADAQSSAGMGQGLGAVVGAAAMFMSDPRLKKNIRRIGTHPSGVGVYEYEYVWGGNLQVGVMADEVEQVIPAAVITRKDGFKMVNYAMLG
jgi:hypothetical protein